MTVTFSEEARRDIFKIGIWTHEQWGEAQVDVYNAHLSALIVWLHQIPSYSISLPTRAARRLLSPAIKRRSHLARAARQDDGNPACNWIRFCSKTTRKTNTSGPYD
jgi:hypothetical protein